MEQRIYKSYPAVRRYQKKLYHSLVEQGLCAWCRKPLGDKQHTRCPTCLQKLAELKRSKVRLWKEQNLCICCGRPRIPQSKVQMCEICWFRDMAKAATGSQRNWLSIKNLLEKQGYRCAYSGKRLSIGKNASLDHIAPVSRRGTTLIANLHWVDVTINFMKHNMLEKDFLSIVKSITQHLNL